MVVACLGWCFVEYWAELRLDDGLCFVQPILKGDATSGYASNHELGQAAFALLNACVMERGVGGDVGNIGKKQCSASLFRIPYSGLSRN
jgi:hypothetical protein